MKCYFRGAAGSCTCNGATNLEEDLIKTINNELIRVGSLWRCGRETRLSPTPPKGQNWHCKAVSRSFWEWMELPDDLGDLGIESDPVDSDGLDSDEFESD
jgi:hypothetical protein